MPSEPEPVDNISRSLGRIEAKLDNALRRQSKLNGDVEVNRDRIDNLEASRTYLKGGLAVVSTLVLVIAGLVMDLVKLF